MKLIQRRLDALEKQAALEAGQCRFVWVNSGETEEQALGRAGAGRPILPTDNVTFISWMTGDEQ